MHKREGTEINIFLFLALKEQHYVRTRYSFPHLINIRIIISKKHKYFRYLAATY